MRRQDLEHLVAAAANIIGDDEFVVIGSQAVLGTVPDPPAELLVSMEADMYPLREPERAIEIDGVLGDGSAFFEAHGYYAHGVDPQTAKAPSGWQDRLVRVLVAPRVTSRHQPVAWCIEVHDLVLAKLARGSERDWAYARTALRAGLIDPDELLARVPSMPLEPSHRELIANQLKALRP